VKHSGDECPNARTEWDEEPDCLSLLASFCGRQTVLDCAARQLPELLRSPYSTSFDRLIPPYSVHPPTFDLRVRNHTAPRPCPRESDQPKSLQMKQIRANRLVRSPADLLESLPGPQFGRGNRTSRGGFPCSQPHQCHFGDLRSYPIDTTMIKILLIATQLGARATLLGIYA
jgi:hypothetical protein